MSHEAARLPAIARAAIRLIGPRVPVGIAVARMLAMALMPAGIGFLSIGLLGIGLLGIGLLGAAPALAQPPGATADASAGVPPAANAHPVPTARPPLEIVRDVCQAETAAYCPRPHHAKPDLGCLTRNLPQLSLSCQSAVLAADSRSTGLRNPVVVKRHQQKLATARRNCRPDYQLYCIGASPGTGGILRCLRDNYPELTPGCQAALSALNKG